MSNLSFNTNFVTCAQGIVVWCSYMHQAVDIACRMILHMYNYHDFLWVHLIEGVEYCSKYDFY